MERTEEEEEMSTKLTREDLTHMTSIQRSPGLPVSHFPVPSIRRLSEHGMIVVNNSLVYPDLPEA